MRDETDERLIELAGGGESEAFEELYYRYRGWVYALARRFTGDDELAADAVQEVFIYLLGKVGSRKAAGDLKFEIRDLKTQEERKKGSDQSRKAAGDLKSEIRDLKTQEEGQAAVFRLTSKMTTFLYPVTKHIALTIKRSRGDAVSVEQAGVDVPAKERTDEEKQRAELAEAMAALDEEHREVVLMRYVDEMSVAETAEALGVAEGTVKSRLSRAMEQLRQDGRTRRYFGF